MYRNALAPEIVARASVEKFGQRPSRNQQFVCIARGHKAIEKNLAGGGERGTAQLLAQSTFQNNRPKPFDRPVRLSLTPQPLLNRLVRPMEAVYIRGPCGDWRFQKTAERRENSKPLTNTKKP